jgi:hypothetical protein
MTSPLLFLILLSTTSAFNIFAAKGAQSHVASFRKSVALYANPINSEGSKYRGDITEEEAFLWFDEAMVSLSLDNGKCDRSEQHESTRFLC